MYFIVSTGRCGSQTIADFLNLSPDTLCVHEAVPRLIEEAPQYLYGQLSHEDAVRCLKETRSARMDGKMFGESNLNLAMMIPALREAFPEAKFIWLMRDGRGTVASFYARGWYEPSLGRRFHQNAAWEMARLRADKTGTMTSRQWWGLSRFEKCCWNWDYKNRLMQRQLKKHGCDYTQIRIEELATEGHRLYDFLGLAHPQNAEVRHLNKASDQLNENPLHWGNWTIPWIAAFTHFCGEVMNEWYPGWLEDAPQFTNAAAGFDPVGFSLIREWRALRDPLIRKSVLSKKRLNDYRKRKGVHPRLFLKNIRQRVSGQSTSKAGDD